MKPTILDRHVHMPKATPPQPHRLVAIDGTHLRCLDCQHTLDVANLAGPTMSGARSTSTSRGIPKVNDPDGCALHPGYWLDSCGPCRSEALAAPDDRPATALTPSCDPTSVPEWAELRARFGGQP